MVDEYAVAQLKNSLDEAKTVLIICALPGDADALAAAIAWQQSLSSQAKDARLTASSAPTLTNSATTALSGLDKISTELGNENLTISFDYSEEKVDKVSYNISDDNQKFYLTIKPRAGEQPLDSATVEFSYSGVSADLLIIIGANQPSDLGELLDEHQDLLLGTPSLVIAPEPAFGSIQLPVAADSSLAQTTAEVLKLLNIPLTAEIATNLLYGIDTATSGLHKGMSPELFELVANLLRHGGERRWVAAAPISQPKEQKSVPTSIQIARSPARSSDVKNTTRAKKAPSKNTSANNSASLG